MPRLGRIPSLTVDPQHHIPSRELVHFHAGYLNNDIEGWQNALNRRASCRSVLAFDVLIQLLYQEARLVEVQMQLVADCKLTLIQRNKKTVNYRRSCTIRGNLTKMERRQQGSCLSHVQNCLDQLAASIHFALLHTVAKLTLLGANKAYKSHNHMPLIIKVKRETFSCLIHLGF